MQLEIESWLEKTSTLASEHIYLMPWAPTQGTGIILQSCSGLKIEVGCMITFLWCARFPLVGVNGLISDFS